jgi:hypothetical protein
MTRNDKRRPDATPGDLERQLEKAAAFIVETCARETTSGNYFIYPEEIPAEIISSDLYCKHKARIVEIMLEYEAIGEVDVSEYDSLDVMVYLDYCPNFEPLPEESDDFPPDREILDPLATRRKGSPEKAGIAKEPETKPSLMERLEEGRRKAEQQDKKGKPYKTKGLEV